MFQWRSQPHYTDFIDIYDGPLSCFGFVLILHCLHIALAAQNTSSTSNLTAYANYYLQPWAVAVILSIAPTCTELLLSLSFPT